MSVPFLTAVLCSLHLLRDFAWSLVRPEELTSWENNITLNLIDHCTAICKACMLTQQGAEVQQWCAPKNHNDLCIFLTFPQDCGITTVLISHCLSALPTVTAVGTAVCIQWLSLPHWLFFHADFTKLPNKLNSLFFEFSTALTVSSSSSTNVYDALWCENALSGSYIYLWYHRQTKPICIFITLFGH